MNLLIKNVRIIDPKSPFHQEITDILISNGIIEKIENNIPKKEGYEVFTEENLHVSPGWFDSSVSFGEPGYENRETIENGLKVAAKSGFTAVAIQPETVPVCDNQSTVRFIIEKTLYAAVTAYPIGALTKKSEGIDLAELYDMKKAGAIAFGDYKKNISNANLLKIALQYTQDFNSLIIAFSQDKNIVGKGFVNEGETATKLGMKGIPLLAEEIIVARNLFLLEYTGGKLHIPTISSANSAKLIKEAKEKGLDVTCSVAVHNLVLNDELLNSFDTRYKTNPPLCDEETRKKLIEAVLDNTIDCITSDHYPLDIEQKKVEFDLAEYGSVGLESAFRALSTILPHEVIVEKLTAGRNIFELEKITISEGEKANMSFFNPEGTEIFTKNDVMSKSKNSAFLNQFLKGKVYGIYNNNQLIKR